MQPASLLTRLFECSWKTYNKTRRQRDKAAQAAAQAEWQAQQRKLTRHDQTISDLSRRLEQIEELYAKLAGRVDRHGQHHKPTTQLVKQLVPPDVWKAAGMEEGWEDSATEERTSETEVRQSKDD